jgi:DNA-binding PadR family transcriptional regulator
MKEARTKSKNELLPGTLEMLILKTLSIESMHGYGIAHSSIGIWKTSCAFTRR